MTNQGNRVRVQYEFRVVAKQANDNSNNNVHQRTNPTDSNFSGKDVLPCLPPPLSPAAIGRTIELTIERPVELDVVGISRSRVTVSRSRSSFS